MDQLVEQTLSSASITRAGVKVITRPGPVITAALITTEMLTSLHSWLWQQVATAQDPEDLDLAIELMEQQRDAWKEAIELMRVMKNETETGPIDLAG